jgi:hypothetical protein
VGNVGRTLRALAAGFAAGIALSIGRAPLGVDVAQSPAVSAGEALAWRGSALAVVALAVAWFGGDRPRLATLAGGAALGFGLHGLVLADVAGVSSGVGLAVVLALLLVAFLLLQVRGVPEGEGREPKPGLGERPGLLIAGAGAALALEPIARMLRLLSGASPADESVFGAIFLALIAFGAGAFGPLVPRAQRGVAAGALVALAALACVESLRALGTFAARDALNYFLKQPPWRLDLSEIGRLNGDVLLGARALLLPAFALGAALFVAARGSRLAWILFGAALAHFALPALLLRTWDADPGLAAAKRVVLGVGLAGVGGAIASLFASASSRIARASGAVVSAATVVVALTGLRAVGTPLSPWERLQVVPDLVLDAPAGLLTVEPTMDLGRVATLDRHRITPSPESETADEQRLRLAWSRIDPAALSLPERRVLLVGQLTPLRARTLLALGATHIDRTGAWHAQMEQLEALLFDGAERPAGRILAPAELDGSGPWVLAVAPPVEGAAPRTRASVPALGPSVVWIDARAPSAHLDWGERAMVSSHGIDDVCIAPWQPAGLPCGEPARGKSPWRRLRQRHFEREADAVAVALQRLAKAAEGTDSALLAEGLARFAAIQERSSPFETQAQSVEVEFETLRLLREAALAREPDLFLRDLWSALAELLSEKRDIELVDQYVAPIAQRWGPWWQLEIALARAELEALDPESAAEHYLRALEERPLDLQLRLYCAQALSMASKPQAAAEQLRAVDAVQPGRRDVRRRLAMELARAGDPAAGPLLEELLREDPTDEELRPFQGTGPFPPPKVEFAPHGHPHPHEGG